MSISPAKSSRETIVCFGCYDYWSSNPGSPVKLMDAMHDRGHRVLWINNIGMNMPRLRKSGLLRRVGLRLKAWVRWLRPHRKNFWVLAPIVLPLFGNPVLERINDRWLWLQIRLAYLFLGIRAPLAFVCMPTFAPVVAKLPREGLIYYYTDRYDQYRDIKAPETIRSRDLDLLTSADLVLCASRLIMKSLPIDRPHVRYLPHAVDFARFQAALEQDTPPPADLAGIPRPRIGYFGSLSDSIDMEMVRYAAEKDPDLQFVFIGRALGDFSLVQDLPNVHFLGWKSYEEIPFYGKHFDVGIMNWKMTEWIRHCNPVKTKEYLSLGLPVVSVPIEEIDLFFSDVVEVASDGPEFLAALHQVLRDDTPEKRQLRLNKVREESWAKRVEEIFTFYREARHVP